MSFFLFIAMEGSTLEDKSTLSRQILSDVIAYSKYAKYLPKRHRRETWDEIIDRSISMHCKTFPNLKDDIKEAYNYVRDKKVLPSMRGLQFSGKPIEISPSRQFNCSYVPIDSTAAFSELMFLLLGGSGVGISVQNHHIDKLPDIVGPKRRTRRHLIGDSIEGWSDAIKVLIDAYFHNKSLPIFDYRDIRPKGSLLKTSGGRAPGPQPLKDCIHNITKVLNGAIDERGHGTQLKSIEAHDLACHIADAVLAGGIRRAAIISFFSFDDDSMLTAKYGSWWELNPQRARANNSAVALRRRIREKTFYDFWEKIKASGSGEPAIYFTNDRDELANPCVTKDTFILTSNGSKQVKDLIGKPFNAIVNGSSYPSQGFWSTGVKPIYELRTRRGLKLKLTDNHKLLKHNHNEGPAVWTELKHLSVGSEICISDHDLRKIYPYQWDTAAIEKGWLLGSLVGDGTFDNNRACLEYWGETAPELANHALELVEKHLKHRKDLKATSCVQEGKLRVSCVGVKDLAQGYDIIKGNKIITDKIEAAPKWFKLGFLRGLFDADGSVQGTQSKGISIRLSQSNLELLERAQRMLSSIGITSTIYHRSESKWRLMPNRKGGSDYYYTKDQYELVISGQAIRVYDYWIGFEDPNKKLKLSGLIAQYQRNPNTQKFFDSIESITPVGEEEVFDCTVEDVHEFCANGIRAHNCGEASLKPGSFCNLTTINVGNIESQEDLNTRARMAARIGTLQAAYTDFHYLRDFWKATTEKDSLLGVSMTGIASGKISKLNLKEAAEIVKEENSRIAKLLGINEAARTTLIKPEGTSSLLLGTSSGIHAWHSPYYIRRLRINKEEPLYKYLIRAVPNLMEDEVFKPDLESVLSIPIKAPEGSVFRDESPIKLLERVKRFHNDWIKPGHRRGENTHNVSVTVPISEDMWDEVGKWMWENREYYNGITVLPEDGGTYTQAPFEACSKEKYEELLEGVRNIDLTKVEEVTDSTKIKQSVACSGGSCTLTSLS